MDNDKIYTVYYPDGTIKKHEYKGKNSYAMWKSNFPALDKVFFNYIENKPIFFKIIEMSEEEIWVEEINDEEYYVLIDGPTKIKENFVYFLLGCPGEHLRCF